MRRTILCCTGICWIVLTFGQMREAWIKNDQITLHYEVYGSGSPVLILNGGPGMNCAGFQDMARTLSGFGYQCILYDQRGTGSSTIEVLDTSTITMDLMAADIEWLRRELQIDSWTVLGHSFGGILAAWYAHRYPEPVGKLIFSSAGGLDLAFLDYIGERLQNNLGPENRDSLAYYDRLLDEGDTSETVRLQKATVLAGAYVFDKTHTPAIAQRLLQVNMTINSLIYDDLHRIGYDLKGRFSAFDRPVLVLQGRDDVISTETAEIIAASFPDARLELIDRCAHYGWLDQPQEYFRAICDFLK